ncbi:MAG TPA: phosphohistidine phosphatase SixA [Thermoanaerobaculia bacterium]|nr:phosphohistidine phosphatase SixA [Thermoanaerobaculia bacterium]
MRICLVRHGEAEASGSDDRRALTRGGRDGVERVALAAASAGVRVERIRHSGKRRALETAEILAARLGCPVDPDPCELLLPGASPQETARWIESLPESTLLVSHLPLIERLAALLVSGGQEEPLLPFPPATLVWLEADGGLWKTLAHITPQSLGRS